MKKFYCDICENEIDNESYIHKITISIDDYFKNDEINIGYRSYDVCDNCSNLFEYIDIDNIVEKIKKDFRKDNSQVKAKDRC